MSDTHDFELYGAGQRERCGKRFYVTLGKDGRLYFSPAAVESLGRPEAVGLMYDARRQVIGVMPCAAERDHAYVLRAKRNLYGRLVTCRNFLEHYKIRLSETVRFVNARVNGDGVMVLDLNVVEGAGRRRSVVSSR